MSHPDNPDPRPRTRTSASQEDLPRERRRRHGGVHHRAAARAGRAGATPAPSDKLHIACVGVGGMGKTNLANCETETIVALCDVDFTLSEPVFAKYPDAKRYKDYRVLLDEQKDIDAVIIATPDHSHAAISMAAMERKKHVYVQKPLTAPTQALADQPPSKRFTELERKALKSYILGQLAGTPSSRS